MPYRVINIYYHDMCYNNHINNTRIQSIASMALMVFPDAAQCIAALGALNGAHNLLKQYSTLHSGTATPTHLLGGVHRDSVSMSSCKTGKRLGLHQEAHNFAEFVLKLKV